MDSTRSYERHATCDRPAKDDWNLVEVRSNGRRRVVSSDHHAYKDYLAKPHAEPVDVLRSPVPKPVRLTREQAQAQAIAAHKDEYLTIMARYHAFGENTQEEALASWKTKVSATFSKLLEG